MWRTSNIKTVVKEAYLLLQNKYEMLCNVKGCTLEYVMFEMWARYSTTHKTVYNFDSRGNKKLFLKRITWLYYVVINEAFSSLFIQLPQPFVLSKLFNTNMINVKTKIHNRYGKTFSFLNCRILWSPSVPQNLSSLKCHITYDAALLGKDIRINVCISCLSSFLKQVLR